MKPAVRETRPSKGADQRASGRSPVPTIMAAVANNAVRDERDMVRQLRRAGAQP